MKVFSKTNRADDIIAVAVGNSPEVLVEGFLVCNGAHAWSLIFLATLLPTEKGSYAALQYQAVLRNRRTQPGRDKENHSTGNKSGRMSKTCAAILHAH